MARGRTPTVREVSVSDDGILARSRTEVILDVYFEGRRVWSFWLHRDGVPQAGSRGRHLVEWPRTLRQFLDGTAHLTVRVHESDAAPVFDGRVRLGSGEGEIAITTADGRPIALDKSLRRVQTFDTRTPADVEPLMRAIGEVLDVLSETGVAPFLAYGTLLGAVRNGGLIGHDSDADLGYLSEHDHPVDVARESFLLQRALVERGHRVTRYSTAAFKVMVEESDGTLRGLDVFGGFMRDGLLHLMGEIITPFRREWVMPLGTATLEGYEFAVPADTDRFLTVTYGPSWRVPDPAFHFTTPTSTHRRFNGWFRGIRMGRALWDRQYARRPDPERQASDFARWVARREPEARQVVDMGCGTGGDVRWFARRGVPAVGFDFVRKGFEKAQAMCAEEGVPARFYECNLLELRSTLSVAGLITAAPVPRVVIARHLIDALGPRGRHEAWRMARLLLADGGRLHVQFLVREGEDNYARRYKIQRRRPAVVARELETMGATIVERKMVTYRRESDRGRQPAKVCRMVVQWE